MPYKNDRTWADACTSQIMSILAPWMSHLAGIVVAPVQQDNEQATDYTIALEGGTIAARVRRPDCRYRDFTIRSRRATGTETELSKLKKGYASRYFYAWTDEHFNIIAWMLLDMDKARSAGLLEKKWHETANKDRKTGRPDGTFFISIPIQTLYDAGAMIANHKIRVPLLPDLVPITYDTATSSRSKKKLNLDGYSTLWEGESA